MTLANSLLPLSHLSLTLMRKSSPLTGDAIWVSDFGSDDVFVVAAVEIRSSNGPDFVVRPINQAIHGVVVDGDGMLHAIRW